MTDHKYFEDVDTEIRGLNDRHPLVFDDESLHGNAALLAAAALIVDWRDNAVTARDRQVRDLEHLIAALQQYRDLIAAGITATWPDYQYETEADRLRDQPEACPACGSRTAEAVDMDGERVWVTRTPAGTTIACGHQWHGHKSAGQ
jgi:hypothetical protein